MRKVLGLAFLAVVGCDRAPPTTQQPDAAPVATVSAPPASPPPDDPRMQRVRLTLASLVKNPKAVKPTAIIPAGDEPWITYEYNVPELGSAAQNRTSATKWEIFLVDKKSPLAFAPAEALVDLDHVGPSRWWRVTAGPFAGSYVLSAPGGIGVQSRDNICLGTFPDGVMPKLRDDCATAH